MHLGSAVLPGCRRCVVHFFCHLDTVSNQSDHDCASKHKLPYRISLFSCHHNLQPEPRALGQGKSLSKKVSNLENCHQLTCGAAAPRVNYTSSRIDTLSNTKDWKRPFCSLVGTATTLRAGRSGVRISVGTRYFSLFQNAQTVCIIHTTSYKLIPRFFPGAKAATA